jgi:hypothetical protein
LFAAYLVRLWRDEISSAMHLCQMTSSAEWKTLVTFQTASI